MADVNHYPRAPSDPSRFKLTNDRLRLGDKLILIVQAEIDLLWRHRLGGGAVWHQDVAAATIMISNIRPPNIITFNMASLHHWRPVFVPTGLHRTAIFRQVNKTVLHTHHDALELPDGQIILLTGLGEGQIATVLQLPAEPRTIEEAEKQARAAFAG